MRGRGRGSHGKDECGLATSSRKVIAKLWNGETPKHLESEQMAKYVDGDFEPMVYTREPDDEDEYNFFSGARFGQLGASDGVTDALKEMGIERPDRKSVV